MKKSDELFKAALAAKAEETEQAKRRIEKMAQHTSSNKDALATAQKLALKEIEDRRAEQIGDLNKALDKVTADADEHIRQINIMFATLVDQEDQRLADYEQFEREIVNGFGKRSNSAEIAPMKSAAE